MDNSQWKIGVLVIIAFVAISFCSCEKEDPFVTVKDIDGNSYRTQLIGNQSWMCENLKVLHFRNGDLIQTTSTPSEDIILMDKPNFQWAYEGNENYVEEYGRLYSFYAIADTRGICPAGWHIPSDEEWTVLTNFLGDESQAQQKLIEIGFNPQFGGIRMTDIFIDKDLSGNYWSGTFVPENSEPGLTIENQVYIRSMTIGSRNVYRNYRYFKNGASVRCIKD
jgi:uncharacterized protein (TIGR02145 family)